uniref:F-box domain-containing protein n=1 Tax=Phytophthora ramorum TaxID=164328 RepID=H3HA83_PHYRM
MELLPADTLKLLSSFLTGHDAFNLSHTSSWGFKHVGDGFAWQRRLRSRGSWQKRFMVAPSLLFQGRQAGNNLPLDSFAYLLHSKDQDAFCLTSLRHQSFSFDVWFSLLPASDGQRFGGILYGLQSNKRDSRPWPHYHQPLVVVNSSGDLHCSVLDAKPVVATDLQSSRWYHLVLSYAHDLQRQDVYLDGEKVRVDTGPLHEEWSYLTHEQVGTGCVTGGDLRFPYRGHLGWYGFNGLIDEFHSILHSAVGGFLTGFDAFNMSFANTWWRNYLSDETFWRERCQGVRTTEGEASWRRQYIQSRSMLFKSLKVEDDSDELDAAFCMLEFEGGRRGCNMGRPSFFTLAYMGSASFSFDVWFGLLPASKKENYGGVLLGLQSSRRESRRWPHYHQQFVMVSARGDLYCSVLAGKSAVASDLQPNRWYHLALTYDYNLQRQEVYLDGDKIGSEVGPWHPEWSLLAYAQIGTGCVTSDTLECPRQGHIGWYGFHGVVDAFRVWRGVLSPQELAPGSEPPTTKLKASLKRDQEIAALHNIQRNVRMQSKSTENEMAPSSCVVNSPEHLPADIVEGLCSFFTGFDAFNLSQSTSRWRNYLSDESFWKTCFRASKASDKELQSWKQSLLPASTDGPFGGILYGIQSSSCESGQGAFYHKHVPTAQ